MKIFLVVAALLLGAGYLAKQVLVRPPLQGMGQQSAAAIPVLVSRARPAVSFALAADMRLGASGWCSLSPQTRQSLPGNGRLWLALYKNGAGLCVTALAEAQSPWHWEAAQHAPFAVLRQQEVPYKGESLHESLYVLDAKADPFASAKADKETTHSLVYRAKLLLEFQNMQVIVEYHEGIVEKQAWDIHFDLPYLNAFQERARAACDILLPAKHSADTLPVGIKKMDTAPKDISRAALSRWVGEMQRRGDL